MATILDTFIRSIIFHRPNRSTYTTSTRPGALLHIPRVEPLGYREIGSFTCGYFIAPSGSPEPCHLLIYAHPNAVDIGMAYDELKEVASLAHVYVLAFEYTGYGLAHDGEASEANVHIDMLSAHCFARRYLNVPANRIIVCGRSIGSAPAARLCATLPSSETPCLLILQCPFSALSDCIQQFSNNAVSIANFFGYNWFRTVDIIEQVRTPVVLHHGTRDESVPIKHAYTLKKRRDEAARPCVTYLYQEEGVGHNNLSRRVLARIIHEKVETAGLTPLKLPFPSRFSAHPSHFWDLFADEDVNTLSAVQALWRERYTLGDLLFERGKLSFLLTMSCCVFSMCCARAWQLYQLQSRSESYRAAANAGLIPPAATKEEFIEYALASWGSPLGIHLTLPNPSAGVATTAILFGAAAGADAWENGFSTPLDSCRYPSQPLLTVAELFVTPGLDQAMQRAIATAPSLVTREEASAADAWDWPAEGHSPPATATSSAAADNCARRFEGTRAHPTDASAAPESGDASAPHGTPPAAPSPALPRCTPFDIALYLQADVVERIQSECERIVSFIADDEWGHLQSLLRQFRGTAAALLSEKASTLCFSPTPHKTDDAPRLGPLPDLSAASEAIGADDTSAELSSGEPVDSGGSSTTSSGLRRRVEEEATLEELEEWLRPWVDRVRPPHASLVAEVPWDYYLLKGRRLVDMRRQAPRESVQAVVTSVEAREMVSTIYYLFSEYSHRCVKPSFLQ